jgi:acyl carrier protein
VLIPVRATARHTTTHNWKHGGNIVKYGPLDISEEAILARVKQHLGEVIGDAELLSTEINMNTKFGSDLELESIEFVALASHLSTEFGDRVNFVDFLSTKSVDEIVSLTVGDVVRYVETCLRKTESLQGASLNG